MGNRQTVPPNGGRAFKGASTQVLILRLVGGFLPLMYPRNTRNGSHLKFPSSSLNTSRAFLVGTRTVSAPQRYTAHRPHCSPCPNYSGYRSSFQVRGNMIKLRNKTSLIHNKEQRMQERRRIRDDKVHQEKAPPKVLSQFYYSQYLSQTKSI